MGVSFCNVVVIAKSQSKANEGKFRLSRRNVTAGAFCALCVRLCRGLASLVLNVPSLFESVGHYSVTLRIVTYCSVNLSLVGIHSVGLLCCELQ